MCVMRPKMASILLFGVVATSSLLTSNRLATAGICASNLEQHGCQPQWRVAPASRTIAPIRVASLARLISFEPGPYSSARHKVSNKGKATFKDGGKDTGSFAASSLRPKLPLHPQLSSRPFQVHSQSRPKALPVQAGLSSEGGRANSSPIIRGMKALVATPFKVRALKVAYQRARAARIRRVIAREIAPIVLREKAAKAAKRRTRAAVRKYATVLRRFRANAGKRLDFLGGGPRSHPSMATARTTRGVNNHVFRRRGRVNRRLQSPLLVPTARVAKTAGMTPSRTAGAKAERAKTAWRLASLGDSPFSAGLKADFQAQSSQSENDYGWLAFEGDEDQDLSAWVALQEKAYAPLVATPVVIRGLKARFARAGHELTKAPGIFETEVDPDLLAPPVKFHSKKNHSKKINLTPPIRRLPAITTKRRSLKRRLLKRWMLVRSAYTKCFPKRLTRLLKQVSRHYGKPVIVISGYRSPAHNRRVGGARRSQHMRCTAADFRVPGVSKMALARYVKTLRGRGGVGTYCRSSYIHLDVGPRRTWHWGCGRGKRRIVKRRRYYRKKAMVRRKAIARKRVVRRAQKRGRNPRLSKRRTNRKTS